MEIAYRLILEMQADLYAIVARHTGRDEDDIRRDADRDFWMRAGQARELGFVDEALS